MLPLLLCLLLPDAPEIWDPDPADIDRFPPLAVCVSEIAFLRAHAAFLEARLTWDVARREEVWAWLQEVKEADAAWEALRKAWAEEGSGQDEADDGTDAVTARRRRLWLAELRWRLGPMRYNQGRMPRVPLGRFGHIN